MNWVPVCPPLHVILGYKFYKSPTQLLQTCKLTATVINSWSSHYVRANEMPFKYFEGDFSPFIHNASISLGCVQSRDPEINVQGPGCGCGCQTYAGRYDFISERC